jgi:divalent metal cation (Fe/Co/Zn/Cd) transporter
VVKPGGESNVTVLVAFGANFAVAAAKTAAAALSGSASMLAEAAHSWADTGNEVFLWIANRRSARPADPQRPLGYGREAYVWSLLAAIGLFVVGPSVSIWHGLSELMGGQQAEGRDYALAYAVLAISFVLEGISLHELTGVAAWDAVGSILVGVLLGVVAVLLIDRNRRFLTGEPGSADLQAAAMARLEQLPDVAAVRYLRLEFIGPKQLFLVASVDLTGDDVESSVARRLRRLERQVETFPYVVDAVLTVSEPDDASDDR